MRLLIFMGCFLTTVVWGQYLRDDNVEQFVPRSQVEDKSIWCANFRYVVVSRVFNGVLTDMVDRSKYIITDHGLEWVRNCAEGTLFSLFPRTCLCSVVIPDHPRFNQDRCVTISGDFQNSRVFQKEQRSGTNTIAGVTYIGGFDTVPFTSNDNCKASTADQYFSVPFFRGNSLSRSSFDLQIQFYMTSNSIGDSVYTIFSNAPCQYDTDDASFIVSYLRNSNRGTILANLKLRNGWEVRGGPEISLTYACSIDPFTAASRTFTFNEADSSNTVRLFGSLRNPRGIQLALWNSELEAVGLGNQGVPLGGFCRSTTFGGTLNLRRGSGQYIVAERECSPFVGQAPRNDRMCIGEMRLTRDC